METIRHYRVPIQMNVQIKRANLSGLRWQQVLLALTACVRFCMSHSSKRVSTKAGSALSEVIAVSAQVLAENLRKCLVVSMHCSAVVIRVRSMIT